MKRSFKHWTPRYIFDRIITWGHAKLSPDAPWLTPEATQILASRLKPTDIGFEWGSGRSTLWLAPRVMHLTSIEHDAAWHVKVTQTLEAKGFKNVTLLHRDLAGDERSPYVHAMDACANGSLDFVLVDGRLREHCVAASLNKLRKGGILILDNANLYLPCTSRAPGSRSNESAPGWLSLARVLVSWECRWTTNGIFDTAIFFKPDRGRMMS